MLLRSSLVVKIRKKFADSIQILAVYGELLASGKISSLGGTVAGKVAKRFVKDMARTPVP